MPKVREIKKRLNRRIVATAMELYNYPGGYTTVLQALRASLGVRMAARIDRCGRETFIRGTITGRISSSEPCPFHEMGMKYER